MKLTYYKTKHLVITIVMVVVAFVSVTGLLQLLLQASFSAWIWLIPSLGPTAVVGGLLQIHNKKWWRSRAGSWLVTVPDLNGTYTGHIEHNRGAPSTRKDCEMIIEQTASGIKLDGNFFKSGESNTSSEVVAAFITTTGEPETHYLNYHYSNKGAGKSNDLTAHEGFARLTVHGKGDSLNLRGYYFTNREPDQTKGIIELTKVKSKGVRKQ